MFALITGGSGSGKSEYAENLAVSWGAKEHLPLYYVATMEPWGGGRTQAYPAPSEA